MSVREATIDDLVLVAGIAAEGFADDPLMMWVFQEPATRAEGMRIAFTGLAHSYFAPSSVVHVVDDDCTTMWRSPAYVEAQVDPDAVAGPRPWAPDIDERFTLLAALMAEAHPHEPHWYLNVIATRPASRGLGLGARALAPVLDVCDVEGMPAYLESSNPRNMTLYRRHGFEQTGEIELPDGPSLFPMWREPR